MVYLAVFLDIYAPTNVCVKDIGSWTSMVLQNYQHFIEMSSKMIYIVAFGGGWKCPRKIHLNTHFLADKLTLIIILEGGRLCPLYRLERAHQDF